MPRAAVALAIGVVWPLWHLPLFALPGVSRFGADLISLAMSTLGNALRPAWLHRRGGGILACGSTHASSNAIVALGVVVPEGHRHAELPAGAMALALGWVMLGRGRAVAPEEPAAD